MIGLMADSHDNIYAIDEAVKFLNNEEVGIVVHAGDLISPFTAPLFAKLKMPFEAIFGNNDGEKDGLRTAYRSITELSDFKSIKFDGLKIAVIHGHKEELLGCVAGCGKYDLVLTGHTHSPSVSEAGTMVVNPGELCGYLSGDRTIGLFDTDRLSCRIIKL